MAITPDEIHYCITDSGDGSAALRLFKNREAWALFVDYLEDSEFAGDILDEGGLLNMASADSLDAIKQEIDWASN